ncbi:MAG: gamma-glutamyl-gamma-aminobutyrate hydrolase family protein [Anaerolineae bacterium]
MKPVIGVPCHSDRLAGRAQRYSLGQAYVDGLRRAGTAVVTIPADSDADAIASICRKLSGLLLAGGGDVQPARYGAADRPALIAVHPERDETEVRPMHWALIEGVPLLAICHGIQMLKVALGGSLIQDILSHVRGALVHQPRPGHDHAASRHAVVIAAGSRLAQIVGLANGPAELKVYSFHHQAVDRVAAGLAVTVHPPDSTIEAVEWPQHFFLVGVQWHPEDMAARIPAQQALFDALLLAALEHEPHG